MSELWTNSGNLILLLIAFCSLAGLTIFIERLIYIRKAEGDSDALLIALKTHIEHGNITEAMKSCDEVGGAVSRILKMGLSRHHMSRDHIENSMEVKGLAEIADLERNAKLLSVVATVAPLLGLLGTTVGFIQAFAEMRQSGLVDISTGGLGNALQYALVTTAAGLVVAIPALIGYNYLISRIERLVLEMRITSSEIVDWIEHER